MEELKLADVYQAKKRIHHMVRRTPFIPSPGLGEGVMLKLESLQNTGAFKVRGAANKILGLPENEKHRGVITFSTGNHGKAVAFVAGKSGVKAVVCLSKHVPQYRVDIIRELGAEAAVHGDSQDEAEQFFYELMNQKRYVSVVPFDDPAVIAGQGTIALEMLEECPEIETLLVPLSGGGLLAGTAFTVKQINPRIRVVGVSIERSPAMLESVKAGKPVTVKERETLADSLLGGIGVENRYTLSMVSRYVDDHVVVKEDEIEKAMFYALDRHSLVIEGAAAVGIAAVMSGKINPAEQQRREILKGKNRGPMGIIVTGSTVNMPRYLEVMSRFSCR